MIFQPSFDLYIYVYINPRATRTSDHNGSALLKPFEPAPIGSADQWSLGNCHARRRYSLLSSEKEYLVNCAACSETIYNSDRHESDTYNRAASLPAQLPVRYDLNFASQTSNGNNALTLRLLEDETCELHAWYCNKWPRDAGLAK